MAKKDAAVNEWEEIRRSLTMMNEALQASTTTLQQSILTLGDRLIASNQNLANTINNRYPVANVADVACERDGIQNRGIVQPHRQV
ncbi:hypothetical protein Bca4012_066850 [Brassica carinata]|uniref:Uncharacterized protein n=1 Tax=Brassica carinata TaxID=52824 RepID=A0A8X7VQZ3_BRACI|nr:hypothetical protein Bca52824_019128 [Brassica carinata]KAG2316007.1 hypothetical protein Bca52824_019129 [Brassica carinata]